MKTNVRKNAEKTFGSVLWAQDTKIVEYLRRRISPSTHDVFDPVDKSSSCDLELVQCRARDFRAFETDRTKGQFERRYDEFPNEEFPIHFSPNVCFPE